MKTYSHLTVISLIINYAVGTGILNLPHTVASASIGVSMIMMIVVSFSSYLFGQYSLDIITRSFALQRAGRLSKKQEEYTKEKEVSENDEAKELLTDGDSVSTQGAPNFQIPNTYTYQFSTLCQLYYGKVGFFVYQIAVIIYMFGTIWGYVNVVSSSLTSVIPMTFLPRNIDGEKWYCPNPANYSDVCNDSYWIWVSIVGVFSCVVVFFDLSEQKILQTIFTGCRFTLLFITCVLIIYCISTQPFLPAEKYTNGNYINPNVQYWNFDLKAIGSLFSAITFSQVYHHSLPGIFQPTEDKFQHKLNPSIAGSHVFLLFITIVIALPGALYFGNDGSDLVTLNFNTWTGDGFDPLKKQPVFPAIISYVIRLLPPLYVITAIPINGLTMSLNIQQLIPSQQRGKKWVKAAINLLCIIPSTILAGLVRNLGVIIEFSGLMGYLLILTPAVILLKAQKECKQEFGADQKTPFELPIGKVAVVWSVIVFNLVGFCLTVYSLIMGLVK